MKRLLAFIFIVCFFPTCKNASESTINFFSPNNYYTQVGESQAISDSMYHKIVRRYLFAIGEEAFLQNGHYDFYAIYYYKRFSHIPIVRVVKSINGTVILSEKRLYGNFKKLTSDTSDFLLTSPRDYIEEKSRFVSASEAARYRAIFDSCVSFVHNFKEIEFGDEASNAYYFDGRNYYVFSNVFLNPIYMSRINRVLIDSNEYIPEDTIQANTN